MFSKVLKVAAAAFLIAAFFGLSQTDPGTYIGFHPSWTNSTTGELYVWLAIPFLIFPAFFLLTDVVADDLYYGAHVVGARLERWVKHPWKVAGAGFLAAFALAVFGNWRVFRGFPFTDDEWGAMYGGQLLAMGKLAEPKPDYFKAVPDLFIYVKDGMMTSFDWLGAMLPWAIADLLGLGNLVHLVFTAATVVAMGALGWRRLGPHWGVLTAAAFLASPMALSLTFSTHAHAVSRAFLAFTLLGIDQILRRPQDWRPYAFAGAMGGLGWMVRPVEMTMLLTPVALWLIFRAVRDVAMRKGLLAFLGSGLVFVAVFVAHSYGVTSTFLPARLAPSDIPPWTDHHKPPFEFLKSVAVLQNRFGENISYNLFLLTIWVFGPLGLFLSWMGARRDTFSGLLLAGVALDLAMGILHEDYGIHVVGPIHYSETTVPLILLIVQGLKAASDYGDKHTISLHLRTNLLTALLASNVFFGVMHLDAVRRSQNMHAAVYGFLDDARFDNSAILARVYGDHWKAFPAYKNRGSFVFQWRRLHPAGERVKIFHYTKNDRATLDALRKAHPDRKFFELRTMRRAPYIEAVEYKWQ